MPAEMYAKVIQGKCCEQKNIDVSGSHISHAMLGIVINTYEMRLEMLDSN